MRTDDAEFSGRRGVFEVAETLWVGRVCVEYDLRAFFDVCCGDDGPGWRRRDTLFVFGLSRAW